MCFHANISCGDFLVIKLIWEVKELPNIMSAKKRVKVSAKKALQNRMVKNGVRTSLKKFGAAVAADPANAGAQLNETTSAIDKAAAKGVIHKNAANRKKARLAKQLVKAAV
ncbi:MAG: 30S ribosomal protein S20 [Clostridia bacterium]|jgi:small subunit ribosomal protein S20|nr:30S ribosomal protein S20 [Clostridia bacterium]